MTATTTAPDATRAEREHLLSLTIEQLFTLAAHNQVEVSPKARKITIANAIMAAEFLPEYPEGIPAFVAPTSNGDADPQGDVDSNAAETMTEEQLRAEAADNAAHDDTKRAVDGTQPVTGQLSFDGLGERPSKSVLNLPALRLDLVGDQYNDGDLIEVTAVVRIDTLKFYPEKIGKTSARKVRGHSAKYVEPAERVSLALISE